MIFLDVMHEAMSIFQAEEAAAVATSSSGRLAGLIYKGDNKHPTIIVEVVASHDRWIWYAFFGVTGSNEYINVLNQLHCSLMS
jgi:hypothetical protein